MKALLLTAAALLTAYCSQSRDKSFSSPFVFVENKGQITDQLLKSRDDIDFKIALNGVTVFIGAGHLHYQWSHTTGNGVDDLKIKRTSEGFPIKTSSTEIYRMDVALIGGNDDATPQVGNAGNYYERYYTGSATGEKALCYERITYANLYPGIDWMLYVKDGVLKHEFIVNEGADAGLIKMKYSGTSDLNILANGGLEAKTPMGYITEQKPYSYQENGKVVSSRFVEKDETVSFELGSYTGKLIIDPTLVWGTYYGDAGFDVSLSVQVDVFGDVYVGGVTEATNNIATTGSHQTTHGGDIRDAYLAKFNSSGQRIWATYYGGSDLDAAYAVSCDPWGYVYLGGHSGSASNISTTGSHQPSLFLNTTANAFLAKFDSSGMRIWGTYYGGLGYAFGAMGLACDNAGSVFMTGATPCNSNIATPGSHQDTHSGGFWQINDAYLVKFDSAGVRQWGTYFGDTSDDWAYAVCTDEDGNAYIAGDTKSEQHMSTSGSHQQVFGGGNSDGFLAKFSGQGNLIWSTYYGGTEEDDAYGVSCKGSTLYLGGLSMSTTGIATTGAYQTVMAGWQDAFLARFDTSGVRQWGTYYGGPEWESNGYGSNNISCDNNLNCYLSTLSRSESGIVLPGAHQPKYGGDFQDLAIAKFDPSGNPLWSTYYGGCEIDAAASLATDNNGHVYVAGATQSGNEIATAGSFKETITAGAGGDGLLAKLSDVPTVPDTIAGPASACEGDVVMYVVSPVFGAISYTWILPNGWTGSSTTDTILATVAAPGGEIVVIAHRDCHNDTLVTEMITVHPLPEPLVSVSFATLSTGSYTSYQWYYNGNALSGATGQSHLAIADGDYYVVVTDTNGCSNNSDTVNISNVMVYEPGRQNAGVSLYPNPVYQDFNLEVSESCAAELSDIQGRTLQRYTVQKGKNMLELPAGLASGVYLLHCKGAHTNITFRVTKE